MLRNVDTVGWGEGSEAVVIKEWSDSSDWVTESNLSLLKQLNREHELIIIKQQAHLSPAKQLELTAYLSEITNSQSLIYGHGPRRQKGDSAGVIGRDINPLPECSQVQLLGHGEVTNHHGFDKIILKHPDWRSNHYFDSTRHPDIQESADEERRTRFYRWHIDAPFYRSHPPAATTLLALTTPEDSAKQRIWYGREGELTFSEPVPKGATAFVSGRRAYDALTESERSLIDRLSVRYLANPYVAIQGSPLNPNGLGLHPDSPLYTSEYRSETEDPAQMIYPLVWSCPVTGRRAFQAHAAVVDKFVPTSLKDTLDTEILAQMDSYTRKQTAAYLCDLMNRSIQPQSIYLHHWQSGDLCIFNNRAVWHSVTGTLSECDRRVFHQCNLQSTIKPS